MAGRPVRKSILIARIDWCWNKLSLRHIIFYKYIGIISIQLQWEDRNKEKMDKYIFQSCTGTQDSPLVPAHVQLDSACRASLNLLPNLSSAHLLQPPPSFGKINLGCWIKDLLLFNAECRAWTLTRHERFSERLVRIHPWAVGTPASSQEAFLDSNRYVGCNFGTQTRLDFRDFTNSAS